MPCSSAVTECVRQRWWRTKRTDDCANTAMSVFSTLGMLNVTCAKLLLQKSIPRGSIYPEILGLLGPTRHRKSMISLRKIEVFGYRAPASGSEAALGALTCSGWPSGVIPGVISGSPGAPFGPLGSDFRVPGVVSDIQFSDCAVRNAFWMTRSRFFVPVSLPNAHL